MSRSKRGDCILFFIYDNSFYITMQSVGTDRFECDFMVCSYRRLSSLRKELYIDIGNYIRVFIDFYPFLWRKDMYLLLKKVIFIILHVGSIGTDIIITGDHIRGNG